MYDVMCVLGHGGPVSSLAAKIAANFINAFSANRAKSGS